MSVVRTLSSKELAIYSTIGQVTVTSCIGYLAAKIFTVINPMTAAIYIGTFVTITALAAMIFKNSPKKEEILNKFAWAAIPISWAITNNFMPIAFLHTLVIHIISTAAMSVFHYLKENIG